MRMSTVMHALLLSALLPAAAIAADDAGNRYKRTHLVANKAKYKPTFAVDRTLINAWGLANRPAGFGGHFWVTGANISFEYVGDVHASDNPKLQKLHQDDLKIITLPVGGKDNTSTGVVFSDSKDDFIVSQKVGDGSTITSPSKFLFASDGGIISAWTEQKMHDGSITRPLDARTVIDRSKEGAQYFGLAISHSYDRLYAANFGVNPGIHVFDGQYAPESITFDMPFDTNRNGKVDAGEYAPFNVQALTTPQDNHHIFVTYAMTQACPEKEIKKGTCKEGDIFPGEEDTSKPGQGKLAEFTERGKLVAVWEDGGHLSAPWGLVFAPDNFGALSGKLLVGNFGDGTIAAYDPETRTFSDVLRDTKDKPVVIDKLWGLMFGNGASLGDSNALYFAAGPNDEKDGLFGSLRPAKK